MNSLEKLVPPLAECEKIPHVRERVAKYFSDSALVHAYSEPDMGWQVLPRAMVDFNDCPMYPAPMLEEIEEKTPGGIEVNFNEHYVESGDRNLWRESAIEYWKEDENAATAALRLWQRIRKAECEG